jgi:hypothetical protein
MEHATLHAHGRISVLESPPSGILHPMMVHAHGRLLIVCRAVSHKTYVMIVNMFAMIAILVPLRCSI